jgi:hypothetical protein
MTSGIIDPLIDRLAKSTDLVPASSGASQTKPRKERGDQASSGGMRTALGETEAAF